MSLNSKYIMPDIFAPKHVKENEKFAKSVAQYILESTKGYRDRMSAKYADNRKVWSGQQSLQDLRDLLQVEENATYFNIKFTPRPIVKKIIRLIVSGYLKDEEAVNVLALSRHIQDRKNRKRLLAKFRMENKELIEELSDMAAVPLTSSEDFTPDSEEELELYAAMNDKEYEETLMQDTLTYILNVNDIDSLKNLALQELAINNLFGVYEYVDSSGKPRFDPIYAEDSIIPPSFFDDFRDGSYFGRWINMHVADIRRRFNIRPQDEKTFYKVLNELNSGALVRAYGEFDSSWSWTNERPYDKDSVRVLHIWWKCAKVYEYIEGERDGVRFFDYWPYIGYTPGERLKGVTNYTINYKTPPTAYEGFFLGAGDFVLEWKEQENIPFDSQNEEVRSPFRFCMPENTGSLEVNSMVSMIKDSVQAMDLAIMKIKMIIARMAPDGYAIDVDSLMELDLGTGSVLSPLDIAEIARQTGDLFYSGKDEDGNPNQIPVRQNLTTVGDKLTALINVYNFEQDNIRTYLGINEFRDGTANKSRTAAAFAESQLQQSNMATEFLYRGWAKMMTHIVKNVGLRVWYHLKYGEPDKGLLRFLGKTNADFIKSQKDLIETAFEFEYKVVLTREEKFLLEQSISSAIAEGSLMVEDAIMIRQIKNSQVAYKYLTFLSKKRRKERMEEAEANQRSAANYSAEAGERVERAKLETVERAAQLEMAKEKERGDNQVQAEMTKGGLAIILEYAKMGQEVPDVYKPLVDFTMQAATVKLQKSAKVTEKELQQMDMEEQLAQAEAELNEAVANGEITPEQRDAAMVPQE